VRPPSTPAPPRLPRSRSIPSVRSDPIAPVSSSTVRFLAPLTRPPTSRPLPFRLRLPHSPPKPKPCGCLPLHRASAAAATRMLAPPPASQSPSFVCRPPHSILGSIPPSRPVTVSRGHHHLLSSLVDCRGAAVASSVDCRGAAVTSPTAVAYSSVQSAARPFPSISFPFM
jgi:hypothetical protein